MKPELLEILCCPETHQSLSIAPEAVVAELNRGIASGTLSTRRGEIVKESLESGLIRSDGQVLYPVRHGIPVMLISESIALTR